MVFVMAWFPWIRMKDEDTLMQIYSMKLFISKLKFLIIYIIIV